MYQTVVRELAKAGLERYEVSNYARPGAEARHNRRYWERRPVLGVGLGAWSHEPPARAAPYGCRRANRLDLVGYLDAVESGRFPDRQPPEILSERAARGEAMFLGLRTRAGVCAERFAAEFGAKPRAFFGPAIEQLVGAGLLLEGPSGGLRLSERGFVLSDSVFEAFV
jgi:oxygen-independent coproporphyrinogen-3 oxidase